MALEGILEKLQEERDRLTKELNRVVKMIKAAGRGAQAAVQEYGRRTKKRGGRARAATIPAADRPAKKAGIRKFSAAQRKAAAARMKKYWADRKKKAKAA